MQEMSPGYFRACGAAGLTGFRGNEDSWARSIG
jgi:hypothetical protein